MSDWPHDPDSDQGSEGMRKYGQAIIAKMVDEEEDFPLSHAEFVEEYGEHPVRIDHETVVSIAEIFEHVDTDESPDIQELHRTLGRALRSAGYWGLDLSTIDQ